MLFRETGDWKKNLQPEDEKRLNDIVRKTLEYRNAYRTSHDTRIAQLWCAILVMRKEISTLQARNRKMEEVYNAIAGAVLKNETEKKDLLRSLENY